jgi:hypothetical protein
MAATKLQMGWTAVQHGSTTITNVDNVQFSVDATLTPYSGDNSRWPTVVVNSMNGLSITLTVSDEAALLGIGTGAVGTFTATHKDAKLATGGDIIFTCVNTVTGQVTAGGAHAAYGSAQMTMMAYSADGVTNPLSFTRN